MSIPSRAELDRGQRALAIVEKKLDLAEKSKTLLRADDVKLTWGRFLRELNTELRRLPQRASGLVAIELGVDNNKVGAIEASLAKYIAEVRERLVAHPMHDEESDELEEN